MSEAIYPISMVFERGSKAAVFAGQWRQIGRPDAQGNIAFQATYKSEGELALAAFLGGDTSPEVYEAVIKHWGSL